MRYEKKFVIEHAHREDVLLNIYEGPFSSVEQHEDRSINSIYFESLEFEAFRDQREGYGQRKKVRLRWYGSPDYIVNPMLEIKSKVGFVGSKLRSKLPDIECDTNDFLQSWETLVFSGNKLSPIVVENLEPIAQISYRRKYLLVQGIVRVTVDDNLAFHGISWNERVYPSLHPDVIIAEIKYPLEEENIPWIIGQNLNLRYTKYSKYASCLLYLSQHSLI